MTTSAQDRLTDQALRSLDPADRELDDGQRSRADELLARIVATDPGVASRELPSRTTARRGSRWLLVPVALAAVVVASLVVPSLLGRQHAYASWKATPTALTTSQATEAATACRTRLGADLRGTDGPSRRQVAASRPVLAEQRGGWTYVALAGPGVEGACLTGDSPDAGEFGYLDQVPEPVRPGADRVVTRSSTSGSTSAGLFDYTEGVVGSDVTRVDITTATGLTVRASVANGRFAAWWPAGDDDMQNPEITEDHQVTWWLADGSRRGPVTGSRTMR